MNDWFNKFKMVKEEVKGVKGRVKRVKEGVKEWKQVEEGVKEVKGVKMTAGMLVFICWLFPGQVGAQAEHFSVIGKSIPELKQETKQDQAIPLFTPALELADNPKEKNLPSLQQIFNRPLNVSDMPKAYSYQDLGFFCKLEVQMEKRAKFPVKVRLGEVQYVERMEGKME